MNIAVIGATGNAGSRIVAELARRGHEVTGIARHPEKLESQAGVTPVRGDVNDPADLTEILRGHDAVVMSLKFRGLDPALVIEPVKQAGVRRFLVVGGAGSLEVAPGLQNVDSPGFPDEYKPEALAGRDFLNALRAEDGLDWTYISPSAFFGPGKRTAQFRLGTDTLLVDANGHSAISMKDFAIALADEIESPRHVRQRFTVGY